MEITTEYDVCVVGDTTILDVVAPVPQTNIVPPEAESVVADPLHTTRLPEIIPDTAGFTFTVANAVSMQEPFATITE